MAERRSTSAGSARPDERAERWTDSRKTARIRVACLRCQRRKIRCDGLIPKCSACQKARTDCQEGHTSNQQSDLSRASIAAFQSRIQWLESVVRQKCPEVDITNASPDDTFDAQGTLYAVPEGVENHTQPSQNISRNSHSSFHELHRNDDNNEGPPANENPQPESRNELAHEIGRFAVSAGTESRYGGPSSGFAFTKLLLAHTRRKGGRSEQQENSDRPRPSSLPDGILISPTPLPSSLDHILHISEAYFEFVNIRFPILHRPSYFKLVEQVYALENRSPMASFQVAMVLAISVTILSKRMKLPYSGEGFAVTAMSSLELSSLEHSLQGLQCLLLLIMYTLHSSFLGLNSWYLNYQAIAAVLDLGLQRDLRAGRSMSLFEQEMRTRIFWVIYSLDRTLATTMGRPIGLRDEACDLRLPANMSDAMLAQDALPTVLENSEVGCSSISYAIQLFKLAQFNSEIKYVLHSISRDTPRYTYPSIPNISDWLSDLMSRLQGWWDTIPKFSNDRKHLDLMCKLQYHEIMMLLLRPSPRIRTPSRQSLITCHSCATEALKIWQDLYQADRLTYSWPSIHALSLSVTTLLYCTWTVNDIATSTKIDGFIGNMRTASNILSAAAEHWPEAKKTRDILDELSNATIRWLLDVGNRNGDTQRNVNMDRTSSNNDPMSHLQQLPSSTESQSLSSQQHYSSLTEAQFNEWSTAGPGIDSYVDGSDFVMYMGAPGVYSNDMQSAMRGLFSDFQPTFNFGYMSDIDDIGMGFQF